MIQYQFFPRSNSLTIDIEKVIDCFRASATEIDSESNEHPSNQVLAILRPALEKIGFTVESGKKEDEKIEVPVLFGKNNSVDKMFLADALSKNKKVVIEVEAGRAVTNNQFLKDIFQASMMFGVEYLVLAVRSSYRKSNDFEKVYSFLETLYISNRITLPLKGILLIGY